MKLLELSSCLKKSLVSLLVLLLSSCASIKTPMPINGSKADGTVTLAYGYGAFESPVIDWDRAGIEAQNRCTAWGYHHATRFGLGQSSCRSYDPNYGCMRTEVNVVYQCS